MLKQKKVFIHLQDSFVFFVYRICDNFETGTKEINKAEMCVM
jgi:hypothetical protein